MPKLSVGSSEIVLWPENLQDGESTLGFLNFRRVENERLWV